MNIELGHSEWGILVGHRSVFRAVRVPNLDRLCDRLSALFQILSRPLNEISEELFDDPRQVISQIPRMRDEVFIQR
jgi:hypothetical protein